MSSSKKIAPKAAPKKAAAPKNPAAKAAPAETPNAIPTAPEAKPDKTFAFKLTARESGLIHQAAGPGGASRFARAVLVAAANGDEKGVLALLGGPAPKAGAR